VHPGKRMMLLRPWSTLDVDWIGSSVAWYEARYEPGPPNDEDPIDPLTDQSPNGNNLFSETKQQIQWKSNRINGLPSYVNRSFSIVRHSLEPISGVDATGFTIVLVSKPLPVTNFSVPVDGPSVAVSELVLIVEDSEATAQFFSDGAELIDETVPDGWQRVIVTYNGETGATILYLNGEQIESVVDGSPVMPINGLMILAMNMANDLDNYSEVAVAAAFNGIVDVAELDAFLAADYPEDS
jgi:hypothetical protein